jgi:hypothetical protein
MNEMQTAQFAVGGPLVMACLILGMIITELIRKLAKERELTERLKRLNSKNYHHRMTMQRAIDAYCHSLDYDIKLTEAAHGAMAQACKESKHDSNADTMGRVRGYKLRANPMGGL